MSLDKVIEVAEGEVGKTEYPKGSNNIIYNTEYYGYNVNGSYYPWCVTFLWWVFNRAGEGKAFFNSGKTASCTALMKLYQAEGRWFEDGNYRRGDIPIMTFSKKREVQHCGLIIGRESEGSYLTIEGNTSPGLEGSQDNGGSVAKKERGTANILGVCRPKYSEEISIVSDYENHWAKDDIEWGKRIRIVNGYEDGTFHPNNNVTRAELIAILHRYDNYRFGGSGN